MKALFTYVTNRLALSCLRFHSSGKQYQESSRSPWSSHDV